MTSQNRVWVAATLDTKIDEALYVCDLLGAVGLPVNLADLSTKGISSTLHRPSSSTLLLTSAAEIAAHHPRGASAVFCGDRGAAVAAMTVAFECFARSRRDLQGLLGIGGSGGTAMITGAMRALPIGVPKVMVSTMASGNVAAYVGACDITMMYSVTDVAGLNRISRRVLGNAAHALAGMMLHTLSQEDHERPAVGLTMFGVTTPLCSTHGAAAHSSLRLPGISRHRHRRAVHGETSRRRLHRRRDRHHHHRSLRLPVRGCSFMH